MDNSTDKSQTPENVPHPWYNSRKRFFLPLIFVVVGGLLLARQLGMPIPDWIFSWQVLLIGAGLASGIVEKFRGGAWLVMILVGGFFLTDELVPGADFHKYLWPIGLIALGLLLFLRPKKPFCNDNRRFHRFDRFNRRQYRKYERMARDGRPMPGFNQPITGFGPAPARPAETTPVPGTETGNADPQAGPGDTGTSQPGNASHPGAGNPGFGFNSGSAYMASSSEDYIDATVVLGAVQKNIVSKNFSGGDITVFMGGTEINLTQADIQGTAIMDITQIMGGTKLIVPPHWEVQTRITSVFGNVEDKRVPGQVIKDKILILDGTSVFGGIEIRSY